MDIDRKKLARLIDLSCVQANHTDDEIRTMAAVAKKHSCVCCFALPSRTPLLVESLAGRSDIAVGGTIGFPDGGATTANKTAELRELRSMGCSEFDMVVNIGWIKSGRYDLVERDIRGVLDAAAGAPLKTILECHYLTNDEIVRASKLAAGCGVAFVKTGTGWAPTGATLENVRLMAAAVEGKCQIKAAGGVRDLQTLLAMVELGVTRFGIGVRTALGILEGTDAGKPETY
ncbi:MAG TPA: deoxyribose-phosphate aldolase [Planctomycetota bacterium]|jgi:deoxyribose-phosphate aldolase